METSTTEQWEEHRRDLARGLPVELANLRDKLREKAKQEKTFRYGTDLPVNASSKGLDESRMREIRTSGLTRGRAVVCPCGGHPLSTLQ